MGQSEPQRGLSLRVGQEVQTLSRGAGLAPNRTFPIDRILIVGCFREDACELSVPETRILGTLAKVFTRGNGGVHVPDVIDRRALGRRSSRHDYNRCLGGHGSGTAATKTGGNPALRTSLRQSRRSI